MEAKTMTGLSDIGRAKLCQDNLVWHLVLSPRILFFKMPKVAMHGCMKRYICSPSDVRAAHYSHLSLFSFYRFSFASIQRCSSLLDS